VHAGALRVATISACAPLVSDVVVTGHGRAEIGALIFPEPEAWARAQDPASKLARRLRSQAREAGGSSRRIARALVLDEPPSMDAGEITDKGYLNQRRVLERRAALVRALYDDADPRVIRIR